MSEQQDSKLVAETSDYATQPKNAPTGAGRINPIRSEGESETRMRLSMPSMSRMNHGRALELKQFMETRGYVRDMDSNIFSHPSGANADFDGNALMVGSDYFTVLEKVGPDLTEARSASKALIHTSTPLDQAEYVNRKLGYLNIDSPEYKAHEVERLRIKEQRRLERIQRKMSSGLTRDEAERADDYNANTRKEMLGATPHATERQVIPGQQFNDLELMDYEEAVARIMAEGKPGWEARIKNLQTKQAEMQAMLARSETSDQARRKQELLDEGYPEAEAERMKGYSKAQWHRMQLEWQRDMSFDHDLYNRRYASPLLKAQAYEEHIQSILETKPTGWEKRVIALRKEQAELLEPVAVASAIVEPPPPPPVLDFSTGDLELPERFIIKDLEGFKFDPDMRFDGLRLPYDTCLFVLGVEPMRAVVLATQEDEDVITLKLLSEQKSELPWHAIATLYVRLNGTKARLKWANTRRALDKRLGMVSSVLGFLAGEQLNELEIETVITAPEGRDIPPPKPGWCYNVVHLTQGKKGKRKDWQGGTHASPREHKRKGYWWPGRKGPIWIKATIVNKGVLGRVDKEYHVTKLNTEASEANHE